MKTLFVIATLLLSSVVHAAQVGDFAGYDAVIKRPGSSDLAATMTQTILEVDTLKNEYKIQTFSTVSGTSYTAQYQSPITDPNLTTTELCKNSKGAITTLTTAIGDIETCYIEFNNGESKLWLVAGFPSFAKSFERKSDANGQVTETAMEISSLQVTP